MPLYIRVILLVKTTLVSSKGDRIPWIILYTMFILWISLVEFCQKKRQDEGLLQRKGTEDLQSLPVNKKKKY